MSKIKPIDFTEKDFKDESLRKRFFSKVNKLGDDDCWVWLGYRSPIKSGIDKGKLSYGHIKFKKRLIIAHRFSYLIEHGSIPDGLMCLHRCDNPGCCNPAHLFLGTGKDNMQDKVAKGRTDYSNMSKGEEHFRSKLNDSDVAFIRKLKWSRLTQEQIGQFFDVTSRTVSRIQVNGAWKTSEDAGLCIRRGTKGERNGRTRLTEDDALLIDRLKTSNLTKIETARVFNISQSQVSAIQNHNFWKHLWGSDK